MRNLNISFEKMEVNSTRPNYNCLTSNTIPADKLTRLQHPEKNMHNNFNKRSVWISTHTRQKAQVKRQ